MRLWPDARTLLVTQAALLAAGAIPLYAFAWRRIGTGAAFLLVLAYLLSPLPQREPEEESPR